MGIKKYKPQTSTLRWTALSDFGEITKKKPEKGLTVPLRKTGGRNTHGHITAPYRGGGHKRRYRIIDFKRNRIGDTARVVAIEYDPNRSARIALVEYKGGERRYILHPIGLKVGDVISQGPEAELKVGNALPLRAIAPGIPMHNIELTKGKGGQIVRSAGCIAVIQAKEGKYAHVKLPSGEVRLVDLDCYATVGQIGNIEHIAKSYGKAGRSRWLNRRPRTRAVAKNPVDHPMGGGEGKSSGGRIPCSISGFPAKGGKTRKRKKSSNKFIVKRRKGQK
ncbi:MAG: 50S ribosomal protein L2 [Candidatus Omnitrophica bacterium]|nr:50S ribosomal protein L2 [Candidatus Omnitrophota bacterium]